MPVCSISRYFLYGFEVSRVFIIPFLESLYSIETHTTEETYFKIAPYTHLLTRHSYFTSKFYLRGCILIDIPGFPYENHLWQHYQGYTFLSKSGKLQTVFLNFLYTHLQSLEQTIAKILQKLKNVFHSPSFQPTCKIPLKNICRHALFLKIAKLLYKNRLMKKTCTRFKLFLYSFE